MLHEPLFSPCENIY